MYKRLCLALLCFAAGGVQPLLATQAATAPLAPALHRSALLPAVAQRSSHLRYYGYLHDRHPESDGELLVYSKTHRTTYHIEMSASTVIKIKTAIVTRTSLHYGQYVIVTCAQGSGGVLQALTVHIVNRRTRITRRTRTHR